ncbi:hypothetical protein AGIG_G18148 [Arapaima gigas]
MPNIANLRTLKQANLSSDVTPWICPGLLPVGCARWTLTSSSRCGSQSRRQSQSPSVRAAVKTERQAEAQLLLRDHSSMQSSQYGSCSTKLLGDVKIPLSSLVERRLLFCCWCSPQLKRTTTTSDKKMLTFIPTASTQLKGCILTRLTGQNILEEPPPPTTTTKSSKLTTHIFQDSWDTETGPEGADHAEAHSVLLRPRTGISNPVTSSILDTGVGPEDQGAPQSVHKWCEGAISQPPPPWRTSADLHLYNNTAIYRCPFKVQRGLRGRDIEGRSQKLKDPGSQEPNVREPLGPAGSGRLHSLWHQTGPYRTALCSTGLYGQHSVTQRKAQNHNVRRLNVAMGTVP